jgi:RimJ/RimL family protein N-acetyltransferase
MAGSGPPGDATNTHRLATDRLLLEVPGAEDGPTLFHLAGGEDRAEVTAGLIWDGPDELGDTLDFVEKARTETFAANGFHWALKDLAGGITGTAGAALGMIGTRPRGEPGRGDVGYWLGRPYWGNGLMGEALSAVLDLCFGPLDMVKVEADIFTTNVRSIRLVERLGMRHEGTIRSSHRKQGRWVDAHIYGILRPEWERGGLEP